MRAPRDTRPAERPARPALGSISRDEVCPAELFAQRMGVSRNGFREMRNRGLRTVQSGKRLYVLGEDALTYFRKLAEEGRS